MSHFIQIDEEGYLMSSGQRLTDDSFGFSALSQLTVENRAFVTRVEGQDVFVEAFDAPLIVRSLERIGKMWRLSMPYGYQIECELNSLCSDEWDRFHGRTPQGVPFVLSRAAQMQLFNAADTFNDFTITLNGTTVEVPTLDQLDLRQPSAPGDVNVQNFWSTKYQEWEKTQQPPGWELGSVAQPLPDILPQIKLPRCRVCVLGCGTGHDAAYLASKGHIVTGVDISPEAIARANALHKNERLSFVQADAFEFAKKSRGEYDLVLEHTFYCAINPERRNDLARLWHSMLSEHGFLLGIFFIMDRTGGPPFGSSEWELRERLKERFDFLYWTRWRKSLPERLGKELVVYARRK